MNGPSPPETRVVRRTEEPAVMDVEFEDRLTESGEMAPVTSKRRLFAAERPPLSVTVRATV